MLSSPTHSIKLQCCRAKVWWQSCNLSNSSNFPKKIGTWKYRYMTHHHFTTVRVFNPTTLEVLSIMVHPNFVRATKHISHLKTTLWVLRPGFQVLNGARRLSNQSWLESVHLHSPCGVKIKRHSACWDCNQNVILLLWLWKRHMSTGFKPLF